MTLKECFDNLQADYTGVMGRLMSEERVIRFLGKFVEEPSFGVLVEALESKNYEEAFRASHNLKGVCQNLGISKLGEVSSELCEELRNGEPAHDITPLVEQVKEEYEHTICALKKLVEEA